MDGLTKNLLALLSSGDIDSLEIRAVVKPRLQTPSQNVPTITLALGPDFDPSTEDD